MPVEFPDPFDLSNFDPAKSLKAKYFDDVAQDFFSINNLQTYWHESTDIQEIQSLPLPETNMELTVTRNPSNGNLTGYFENFGNSQIPLEETLKHDKSLDQNSLLFSKTFLSKLPGTENSVRVNCLKDSLDDFNIESIDSDAEQMVKRKTAELSISKTASKSDQIAENLDTNTRDGANETLPQGENLLTADSDADLDGVVEEEKWYEEVDIKKDINIHEVIPDMAFSWPFELDSFQKSAIHELEKGNSVFVSAHTSAGKTVVAEYAIALSLKHMTRTIYTSPIKALSNQKFRDFKQTFTDVGLITGDVQINPDASCLIMTTEILRSMLYMNNDIIKELEYIIFDEVHYINDADRGVVWEEVLILLPETTKLVLLSATVPNVIEFASWIGKTKHQKIFICKTTNRPTPLEYNLYIQQDASVTNKLKPNNSDDESNEQRHNSLANLPENEKPVFQPFFNSKVRKFNPQVFSTDIAQKAIQNAKGLTSESAASIKAAQNAQTKQYWLKMIRDLGSQNLLPAIVFIFSKARIDMISKLILDNVDLNSKSEADIADSFFRKSISQLKKCDQDLPQVKKLHEIIKKGFAVHHSGVLPILKEIVEMLFQRGYIKVLLATETFGMGVNMPARTVIFEDIEKFDGTSRRTLLSGEFTQMSGRAGRRGIDDIGRVVLTTIRSFPNSTKVQKLITDEPEVLKSKFKLTYRMILNLLRVELLDVEHVIKHSFLEFSSKSSLPGLLKQMDTLKVSKSSADDSEPACEKCSQETLEFIEAYQANLSQFYTNLFQAKSKQIKHVLCPGRLVYADCGRNMITPVIIIDPPSKENIASNQSKFYGISLPKIPLCLWDSAQERAVFELPSHESFIFGHLNFNGAISIDYDALYREGPQARVGLAHYSYFFIEKVAAISNHVISADFKAILNQKQYSRNRPVPKGNLLNGDSHKDLKKITITFFNNLKRRAQDWQMTKKLSIEHKQNFFNTACFPLNVKCLADCLKLDKKATNELKEMEDKVLGLGLWKCQNLFSHMKRLWSNIQIDSQIVRIEELLNKREQTQYLPEYSKRLALLKHMGHIDKNNLVTLKGRVACEFCIHELLMTELLMNNGFKDMSIAVMASVLSSLIHEGPKKIKTKDLNSEALDTMFSNCVDPKLKESVQLIFAKAKEIAAIQQTFFISSDASVFNTNDLDSKASVSEELADYMNLLNFDLCETVYHWTKGESFSTIISGTEIQEGIVVRCIQRLEEFIRNLREAARLIGELTLQEKTEEALNAIKRDIVFSASLYTD